MGWPGWGSLLALLLLASHFVAGVVQPYDEAAALVALRYSQAAYCPADALTNWTCRRCAELPALQDVVVAQGRSRQTLAYVGRTAGPQRPRAVVAFRGTVPADLINWIADFEVTHVTPWPGLPAVAVHRGFYDDWRSVQERVTKAVQAVLVAAPDAEVHLTGHSLGAAMAALCAFHLTHVVGVSVTAVYTFGQPRVGNEEFATLYDAAQFTNWRVTHYRDPIPELPFVALGYEHPAGEAYYNEACSQHVVCRDVRDPRCARAFNPFTMQPSDHHRYLNLTVGGDACDALRRPRLLWGTEA